MPITLALFNRIYWGFMFWQTQCKITLLTVIFFYYKRRKYLTNIGVLTIFYLKGISGMHIVFKKGIKQALDLLLE